MIKYMMKEHYLFIKTNFKLVEKSISYDDFVKLASAKNKTNIN